MSIPFYARRFISGETYSEAFAVVRQLNEQQIGVTLDALGENVTERQQALDFTKEYEFLIQEIADKHLMCDVSVKLTMLGLDIDEDFCAENIARILTVADKCQRRVALDMEGTPYTERTLRMYELMAKKFKSVEAVLQAYLHRTELDIQRVLAANGRVRLCKGAYKESPQVCFQSMSDIADHYIVYAQKLLLEGTRVCLATHDDRVLESCMSFIKEHQIPNDRYEFQMLYGMRQKTWAKIREQGHNMTIYVPYGQSWRAYYTRRLAERKENIFFVLKNFFRS